MSAYRDSTHGARARLRELLAERESDLSNLSPGYVWTFRRRFARTAFGTVLVGALGTLLTMLIVGWGRVWLFDAPEPWVDGALTAVLLSSWVVAAFVWIGARLIGAPVFRHRMARELELRGDLYASLEQARNVRTADAARAIVHRIERRSAALPLLGVSLLLPLTLHYGLASVLSGGSVGLAEFDTWIIVSSLLVGHCHIVLGVCAWRYARRLHMPSESRSTTCAVGDGWAAWTRTVLASTIPGLVFFGIPVFLVAVTGLFVPVLFSSVTNHIWHERRVLA